MSSRKLPLCVTSTAGAVCLVLCAGLCWVATAAEESASITVHSDQVLGDINPLVYGYFTEETLGSYEGAIWSELLFNRKFGFEDRQPRVAIPQLGTPAGWQPLTLSGQAPLHLDSNEYYSPPYAQRITLTKKEEGPAGVAQKGLQRVLVHLEPLGRIAHPLRLKQGEQYLVSVAVKGAEFAGQVFVALGKSPSETVAEHAFDLTSQDWSVYETRLVPAADVEDAQFMIFIKEEGTVWVDSASLRRADLTAENGFRKDGLEITRNVAKPTSLRWPGGCYADDYHWRNGIGPCDQRPDVWTRPWQEWTANDVGTDEFVALCRSLNAEPYICVNYGTGTPEEAADWVEYCNGSSETEWGKVRAENGHPEPYNVRYWNIGNEIYLGTEFGGTNGTEYGKGYLRFIEAMRAVDPSIQFVSVGQFPLPAPLEQMLAGDPPFKPMLRFWPGWPEQFLSVAAQEVDQFSIHFYGPGNVEKATPEQVHQLVLSLGDGLSKQADALYDVLKEVAPGAPHFPIAIDEWGIMMDNAPQDALPEEVDVPVDNPDAFKRIGTLGSMMNLRQALGEATVLNAVHRRPEHFGLGNKKILWGYIAGDIAIGRDDVAAAPAALMMGLYATTEAWEGVKAEATSATFSVQPTFPGSQPFDAAYLDVSARRKKDGGAVEVFVVNRNWEQEIAATVSVPGAKDGNVQVVTLNGPDLTAINTFEVPDRVSLKDSQAVLKEGVFEHTFPAHSLTRLTVSGG